MKSLYTRSLSIAVGLGVAAILLPGYALAVANDISLSAVTATSTPAYANPGFATTTRATTGDQLHYVLTLTGGTPLLPPIININSMGSTTMLGSGLTWSYSSTTISSSLSEGAVPFYMSFGGTTGAQATTTISQSSMTTTNVTFDKTAPTLVSSVWTDTDSSTQFSAGDTFRFTFSEFMATTTLSNADLKTVLGLTNSHTFSTTTAPTWNTAGTQLTVTLGAATTVTGADTVQMTTAVKDAIGNAASGAQTAIALGDTTAPGSPTGLADTTINKVTTVSLVSVGSSAIRYTTDGTTPSCTEGTVYGSAIVIAGTVTLKAIGCDEANLASSVVTAVYTFSRTGTGSVGGGGSRATPATPATPAAHPEGCIPGNLFNTVTGKSCTMPATPAVPATHEGCALGNLFSTTNGRPCSGGTSVGSNNGQGVSAAVHAFKSDSTIGSLGGEVKALQEFLNSHGYTVAVSGAGSAGNETETFGSLTRAALIKFQKAKKITPAVGYFGPLTRAAVLAEQ